MTLHEIVNQILEIAQQQPNINYVGEGDIYELNKLPNINYSVFYITQGTHQVYENTLQYTFNLFYIDRLMADNSNRLQIQSQGMLVINNIINLLNQLDVDIDIVYPVTFTSFNQRFADECSGVFAEITINVDNNLGICGYE